jgi:hypothetical protein
MVRGREGNPWSWPLIWRTNRHTMSSLSHGQGDKEWTELIWVLLTKKMFR